MTFRFRKFSVEDDLSTMKIGTDAFVLGAWIDTGKAGRILDIGTGCGVIALMLAQRSNALVDAIDIHKDSADQARSNFNNSPWKERLTAWHRSLIEHARSTVIKYDIIVTNPPFFRNSLKSTNIKRNLARHDAPFILTELFEAVNIMLHEKGSFYLIAPAAHLGLLREIATNFHLPVHHILKIRPKENKNSNRVIVKFSRIIPEHETVEELIIRYEDDSFTQEYKELTANFHLSLP